MIVCNPYHCENKAHIIIIIIIIIIISPHQNLKLSLSSDYQSGLQ